LWAKFQDYMLGSAKLMVNSFPEAIRPHVFEEKVEPLYEFLNTKYVATNFEYYLDYNENTYNILMIGPTGAGKSRLINVIFNREVCLSDLSLTSVTKEIYFVRGQGIVGSNKREIIVADTIGLCDTEWNEDEVLNLIKDRVSANVRQINAVFIVINANRLLKEFARNIREVMKWLKYDKGQNRDNFTFVLTHCDGISDEKKVKLANDAKQLFQLKDTVNTIYLYNDGKEQKTTEKFDRVVCTGFPNAETLNEKGIKQVSDSYEAMSPNLYHPCTNGPLTVERDTKCVIL